MEFCVSGFVYPLTNSYGYPRSQVPIKFQSRKWVVKVIIQTSIFRDQGGRTLCGVMRIGLVAKGLLSKDDMDLELVLMCKDKPTETLLNTVKDNLPIQIQKLIEEKYEVEQCVDEALL